MEYVELEDVNAICPLCAIELPLVNMVRHMAIEHPFLAAVWLSLHIPSLSTDEIVQYIQDIIDEQENEYEQLLELCDTIGYHYVGVDDIEKVAPFSESSNDDCPICIEPLNEAQKNRKINVCGHIFCASCIETWLEKHKTCPVCKKDTTANDESITNQMASISISDSSPSSSSLPSSDPPASSSNSPSTNIT